MPLSCPVHLALHVITYLVFCLFSVSILASKQELEVTQTPLLTCQHQCRSHHEWYPDWRPEGWWHRGSYAQSSPLPFPQTPVTVKHKPLQKYAGPSSHFSRLLNDIFVSLQSYYNKTTAVSIYNTCYSHWGAQIQCEGHKNSHLSIIYMNKLQINRKRHATVCLTKYDN